MVQVLDGRLDGVPEFESLPMLVQPWLALLTETVTSAELFAIEHIITAVRHECDARREVELAFSWLQQGEAQFALDWFTYMTQDIGRASWHWGQSTVWLNEHGVAERMCLYQPLMQQVLIQQQRLTALVERVQGQMARYAQEWGIALTSVNEVGERDEDGGTGVAH